MAERAIVAGGVTVEVCIGPQAEVMTIKVNPNTESIRRFIFILQSAQIRLCQMAVSDTQSISLCLTEGNKIKMTQFKPFMTPSQGKKLLDQ